jgi:hypothetical protein
MSLSKVTGYLVVLCDWPSHIHVYPNVLSCHQPSGITVPHSTLAATAIRTYKRTFLFICVTPSL